MNQKMNLVASLAVLSVLSHSAHAQIDTGTVILIYMSQDKAVIAGDSLVGTARDGKMIPYSKKDCKLAALGSKTVFAGAGYGGIGALLVELVGRFLVKLIERMNKSDPQHRLKSL
jgi:hypothetical protein